MFSGSWKETSGMEWAKRGKRGFDSLSSFLKEAR